MCVFCRVYHHFAAVRWKYSGHRRILGNTTQLSSFWVLFSILLFGGVFGIVGMVIGVPVFGFIYHLIKGWMHDRLDEQAAEKREREEIKEESEQ